MSEDGKEESFDSRPVCQRERPMDRPHKSDGLREGFANLNHPNGSRHHHYHHYNSLWWGQSVVGILSCWITALRLLLILIKPHFNKLQLVPVHNCIQCIKSNLYVQLKFVSNIAKRFLKCLILYFRNFIIY